MTHHFPGGKEELIVAVVERTAHAVDAMMLDLLHTASNPREALIKFFDMYADRLDEDPDRGCPVAASVVDASATYETVREAGAAAFSRWTDNLTLLLGDADLAATVVSAMEGSILLARANRDPDLIRRVARVLAQTLLRSSSDLDSPQSQQQHP